MVKTMNNKFLYSCFNKWIGSIWFIADTHFGDDEMKTIRSISDDELVNRINIKVSKNDTLVLLGDVGDLTYIKKLKAGYKILILGNHDRGASNYQRKTITHYLINGEIIPGHDEKNDLSDIAAIHGHIKWNGSNVIKIKHTSGLFSYDQWYYYEDGSAGGTYEEDNNLFDEVYEGALMINEKIMLSHETLETPYTFNIHGHDHNGTDFKKYVLKRYDADMSINDMSEYYLDTIKKDNLVRFNVCADWVGYSPVSLKNIMKSGVLKNIVDIHREAIDKVINKKERNS